MAPIPAWYISRPYKVKKAIEQVSKEDRKYLMEIGARTWDFFKDFMNEENNFLVPDNYQEDRKEKIAHRSSSTNIGLGMLAVISAYDLGYLNLDSAVLLIEKTINTINKLQKWNGHLYNWYNTKTLEPLIPRFVSSVDSGNFVGYLYVVKQFLMEVMGNVGAGQCVAPVLGQNTDIRTEGHTGPSLHSIIQNIDTIITNTDFTHLYSEEKRLFSIGFSVEENKLINSYYDLLASEARGASLAAIAKKDISPKHWDNMSRTLTSLKRYKGLVSWAGTAFEYLMPNINIPKYEGSLLDESCRFMIMSQKEYAKKLNIPWGISEAAFNLKDLNNNYQYKEFGVPWLGLKRGLKDDMVVSPYSVFLSMEYGANEAIANLRRLEQQDMYGMYGFYESIDYTASRLKYEEKYAPIKTYMAHHQGLILVSINNLINNEIIVKRFKKNPEIQGVDILLQERMPEKAIITKKNKEKIVGAAAAYLGRGYKEAVYSKVDNNLRKANTISNGSYMAVTTDKGEGFSKYGDVYINRYKETSDLAQGIFFYIKNVRNKKIWSSSFLNYFDVPDKYSVSFAPHMTKYKRQDSNIESSLKVVIAPNDPVEIRRLELKNTGSAEEVLEVTSYFEPVLSEIKQDYAHTAFNNLFLIFEELERQNNICKKKKAYS